MATEKLMKLTASCAVKAAAVNKPPGPQEAKDRFGNLRPTIWAPTKVKGTDLVKAPALTIVDTSKMDVEFVERLLAKSPPSLVGVDAPPEEYSRVRRGVTADGKAVIAPNAARAVPIKGAS